MPYLLALSLIVAPLYVWRFDAAGLPLNFLLVWVVLVWLGFIVWLARHKLLAAFIAYIKNFDRTLFGLIILFFAAGCISLMTGGVTQSKIGQFIVLFVQPLSLFFLANFTVQQEPHTRVVFRRAVYGLVAVAGALALVQYFTLASLPVAYWGNSAEPKRAVGFFGHPDMFGLFLTPLLAWLIPDVLRRLDGWRQKINLVAIAAWLLGGVGLLLSLSRGAWLGFAVAAVAGIIIYGRKRYWLLALGAIVSVGIVVAVVPNLRYRLILPFKGEKSSLARLSLWHTGNKMIHDNPILGKGLDGFGSNWYEYNTDPNLDHYNFPHNILLNFWVDTGLVGVVSFAGLVLYGLWQGWRSRKSGYALGLALFLIALVVHGLIDTPYLKNDLAMVFWLIYAISLV
jgi:O-antigen ligase